MKAADYVLITKDGFKKIIPGDINPLPYIQIAKRKRMETFYAKSTEITEASCEKMDFILDYQLSDFKNHIFVYIEI